MKRLGIRKVVTKAFNSKAGQTTDKVINAVVTAPGTIARKIDSKVGIGKVVNKAKIDVTVQGKQSNANLRMKDVEQTIKMSNQAVKDAKARDEFDVEKAEGIKFMKENGVDTSRFEKKEEVRGHIVDRQEA